MVANLALVTGVVDEDLFAVMLVAVVLTTVAAPYLLAWAVPRAKSETERAEGRCDVRAPTHRSPDRSAATRRVSGGGTAPAAALAARRPCPTPVLPEQGIDLGVVGAPDRHAVQPLQVLEVPAGDLAQRPALVASERDDAPGRVARRRPGRARAHGPGVVVDSPCPIDPTSSCAAAGSAPGSKLPADGSVHARERATAAPGSRRRASRGRRWAAGGGRPRPGPCRRRPPRGQLVALARVRARSTPARRAGSRSISQAWLIRTILSTASGSRGDVGVVHAREALVGGLDDLAARPPGPPGGPCTGPGCSRPAHALRSLRDGARPAVTAAPRGDGRAARDGWLHRRQTNTCEPPLPMAPRCYPRSPRPPRASRCSAGGSSSRATALGTDAAQREQLAAWESAFAACGLPVAGLDAPKPRARFALAAPLAATIPGEAELLDVWLVERLPAWRVREALGGPPARRVAPRGRLRRLAGGGGAARAGGRVGLPGDVRARERGRATAGARPRAALLAPDRCRASGARATR